VPSDEQILEGTQDDHKGLALLCTAPVPTWAMRRVSPQNDFLASTK